MAADLGSPRELSRVLAAASGKPLSLAVLSLGGGRTFSLGAFGFGGGKAFSLRPSSSVGRRLERSGKRWTGFSATDGVPELLEGLREDGSRDEFELFWRFGGAVTLGDDSVAIPVILDFRRGPNSRGPMSGKLATAGDTGSEGYDMLGAGESCRPASPASTPTDAGSACNAETPPWSSCFCLSALSSRSSRF